jgi:hypothetical protein
LPTLSVLHPEPVQRATSAFGGDLHAEVAIAEGAPPVLTQISTAFGLEVPNKPRLKWRLGVPLLEPPVVFE